MLKRFAAVLAVFLVASAGVAQAGEGYSDEDSVATDEASYAPGEEATFTARTFAPGTPVTFTLFSEPVVLGTVNAAADGVATLTTTIPSSVDPGSHTLEASGTGVDGLPLTVTTTVTVAGSGAAPGPLPTTGSDSSIPMSQLGVAAVAVGGLLLLLANKRRSNKALATDSVDAST